MDLSTPAQHIAINKTCQQNKPAKFRDKEPTDLRTDDTDAVTVSVQRTLAMEEDEGGKLSSCLPDAISLQTFDPQLHKQSSNNNIEICDQDSDIVKDTIENILDIKSPLPSPEKSLHYNISRGLKLAMIINNVDFEQVNQRLFLNSGRRLVYRDGSDKDVAAIKRAFIPLGWHIDEHLNLTHGEISVLVKQLRNTKMTLACLAIFILSHGQDNGSVWARDGMYNVHTDIVEPLAAHRCSPLAGKPKLIFVQACQGDMVDDGTKIKLPKNIEKVKFDTADASRTLFPLSTSMKIPNFGDFLLFQSSFWDHLSFRNGDGSWFIQLLCREIEKSDVNQHLYEIVLNVTRAVALEQESKTEEPEMNEKKQIPVMQATLMRKVFLKKDLDERSVNSPLSPLPGQRKRRDGRHKQCPKCSLF